MSLLQIILLEESMKSGSKTSLKTLMITRMWNRTDHIEELILKQISSTKGLIGYWPLNECTGSSGSIFVTTFMTSTRVSSIPGVPDLIWTPNTCSVAREKNADGICQAVCKIGEICLDISDPQCTDLFFREYPPIEGISFKKEKTTVIVVAVGMKIHRIF